MYVYALLYKITSYQFPQFPPSVREEKVTIYYTLLHEIMCPYKFLGRRGATDHYTIYLYGLTYI